MKKTLQFLFAMSILIEGQNSFAGTNEIVSSLTDKPVFNTPLISSTRGQQFLIVLVMDEFEKPISGAHVSAPCTGHGAMMTNESGMVQFPITGNCNCNGASANVTTSSCNTNITLSCSTTNEAICK
jgi:hypothetical protein